MAQKELISKVMQRVLDSFSTSKHFNQCLKQMKGVEFQGGVCTMHLKVEQEHTNVLGTLHGGLTATITDVISFLALGSYPPFVASSRSCCNLGVTSNLHLSYLNPVKSGEDVFFKAKTVNIGQRLAFVEISVTNSDSSETFARGNNSMIRLIYDYCNKIIEDYNETMKVEGEIKFLTCTSDIVEVRNTTFKNSYGDF